MCCPEVSQLREEIGAILTAAPRIQFRNDTLSLCSFLERSIFPVFGSSVERAIPLDSATVRTESVHTD